MRVTVVIALAGALGAVSRHQLESFVNHHWGDAFPWGTFVVNVLGSLALGALVGVFARRLGVPLWVQAGATVGFLGAFTTFSTLSLQVYRSLATGHFLVALANALGSLTAGTLALYAGILLARTL
ncbi:MAG TPA: CrcB family protein [Gaiellaceae bacterium]|nr:CrcB family protein [Gaiellaceae bacterium]